MLKMLAAMSIVALALGAAAAVAGGAPGRSPGVQQIGVSILRGDRVTEGNFALAPGVPVRVTVTNHTHEFHTFTVPGLALSELILPAQGETATKTTFSFTPLQRGSFAWHCLICPAGMHGRPHTMGGIFYLIINPSVMP